MTHARTNVVAVSLGVLVLAGRLAAQQPAPRPPMPAGGAPMPSDSALDFNRTLGSDYWAKLPGITGKSDGGGRLLDPNGNPIAPTTTMGLLMIRDMYAAQSRQFADGLQQKNEQPRADKVRELDELRQAASELDDLYQNMIGMERSINELEARASTGPGSYSAEEDHKQLSERAKAAEARGDTATAAALRQTIARHPWTLYMERRQAYYAALDKNPILGIHHNGQYFWQALRTRLTTSASTQDWVDLYNEYIKAGRDHAIKEAERAEGVTTMDELWKFGSPRFARQQRTWTAVGGATGSALPGQLMDEVTHVRAGSESGAATTAGWNEFWLNVAAGGAVLIPGVGPFITAGIVAYQVTLDGTTLVITLLDEQAARESGGTTGHVYVITEEDRRAAAAGKFVISLLTSLGDLSAVKNIRVVKRGETGAAQAARAERPAAGAATTTPPPTVDPNRTLPPGAAAVDPSRTASSGVPYDPRGATVVTPGGAPDPSKTLAPPGATGLDPNKTVPPGAAGLPPGSAATTTGNSTTIITTPEPGAGRVTGDATTIVTPASTTPTPGAGGGLDPNKTVPPGAAGLPPGSAPTTTGNSTTIITTPEPGAGRVTGDGTTIVTPADRAATPGAVDPNKTVIEPQGAGGPRTETPPAGDKTAVLPDEQQKAPPVRGDDPNKPKPAREMTDQEQNDFLDYHNRQTMMEGAAEEAEGALKAGADPAVVKQLREATENGDEVAGYELAKLRRRLEGYDVRSTPKLGTDEFKELIEMRSLYSRYLLGTLTDADITRLRELLKSNPKYFRDIARRRYTTEVPYDPKTDSPGVKPRNEESFQPVIPPDADLDTFEEAVRTGRKTRPVETGGTAPARADGGAPAPNPAATGPSTPTPGAPSAPNPPSTTTPLPRTGGVGRTTRGNQERAEDEERRAGALSSPGAMPTGDLSYVPVDPSGPTGGPLFGGAGSSTASAIGNNYLPGNIPPGPLSVLVDEERTFDDGVTRTSVAPETRSAATGGILNLADPMFAGGPLAVNNWCCETDVQWLVMRITVTISASSSPRERPSLALAARSFGEFMRRLAAPARASLSTGSVPRASLSGATASVPPATAGVPDRLARVPVAPSAERGAQSAAGRAFAVITSLGASQGEAFTLQLLNSTGAPIQVAGDSIVVQPLKRAAVSDAQRQLQRTLGGALKDTPLARVEGYCLNFALAPPSSGMLFRIASQEIQERYRHIGRVLNAADRLAGAGGLHPDTDVKAYVESIKQYATWTRLEKWDLEAFGAAWLDRTKKTAASMKRNWTSTMEQAILSAAPGRWRDIQAILAEADAAPVGR